jgi:hypothetical protein
MDFSVMLLGLVAEEQAGLNPAAEIEKSSFIQRG